MVLYNNVIVENNNLLSGTFTTCPFPSQELPYLRLISSPFINFMSTEKKYKHKTVLTL